MLDIILGGVFLLTAVEPILRTNWWIIRGIGYSSGYQERRLIVPNLVMSNSVVLARYFYLSDAVYLGR